MADLLGLPFVLVDDLICRERSPGFPHQMYDQQRGRSESAPTNRLFFVVYVGASSARPHISEIRKLF